MHPCRTSRLLNLRSIRRLILAGQTCDHAMDRLQKHSHLAQDQVSLCRC
jgi:hypothetical protein